jgi:hypothetical protein
VKIRAVVVALNVLSLAGIARAVIVAGGDGTQNTADPNTGVPWDHVGTIGGASGIYLGAFSGGYWVATATHVGAGNFTLGGTTYALASGSGVQIGGSDLTLFRITGDPGLSSLTISSTAPAVGAAVTMIGNGVNRGTAQLYWSVNQTTTPWTWTPLADSTGSNASGYAWGSGNALRWGTNTIAGSSSYNVGTGATNALVTVFDPISGEAQGATGDSGGAMFYFNSGTSAWELTGVMGAVTTFSGQPGSTAVFSDATFMVDLASYHDAIITAIPEPGAIGMGWAAFAAAVAMRFRRRLI